jgi:hypothetical protein
MSLNGTEAILGYNFTQLVIYFVMLYLLYDINILQYIDCDIS